MININSLTEDDIGRNVVYVHDYDAEKFEREVGVITSFNDKYVFVRYNTCGNGQATNPHDLSFI